MLVVIILLSAIVQGIIALFVLLKNHKSATNILFFFLSLSLIAWAVINFWLTNDLHASGQLLLYRLLMASVVAENTFFWLFAHTGPNNKLDVRPIYTKLLVVLSILALGAALSPFLFTKLAFGAQGARPVTGPGMLVFVLHAIVSNLSGLRAVYRRFKKSKGISRQQYRFIFLGSLLLWGVVPVTNFLISLATQTLFFARISPIYTLAFSSLIAYAIVRHKYFDIKLIVARSVAFILLLGTLAGLYATAVFTISTKLFPGGGRDIRQTIFNASLAIVLAFTFQPLRRFFEKITDVIFFRNRYDSQEVLNAIGKILAQEIQLEPLLKNSLEELCKALSIEVGQFMIFNDNSIYKAVHYGSLPKRIMVVPTMRKLRHTMLVADELEGGEQKKILDEYGVRVSLRLQTHDEFVGFLFLGDKLSGDIYSNQDLQLLEILAQELSIAIVNSKAYEEIEQFNITLQERIEHATARLRVANRNLKALDKAKDEFISMASHQLRTPLTTIKGYLSMIIEGDAGQTTSEQKEFLDYAFGGAERMVALISDLLNVSRLSAGRFVIEKKPTDLVSVVADEVRQLQSHAEAKHLRLVFTAPKRKLPMIELDEGKTRQVIMNYIDNAIYYTKQGEVHVSLDTNKGKVELRVKDSGIGVPEVAKKKLFSKFFRAENAQVARPDGTGLGLYLAKRVVEDQGGEIIFDSEEGKGSTFGFAMPLAPLKPQAVSKKG